MNKNKGSITIFLSMILLVVVSIVFATTELGRIEVGHTMASRVTYMAEDSCFSQYVKEIYEDYGIMCLWMNEKCICHTGVGFNPDKGNRIKG